MSAAVLVPVRGWALQRWPQSTWPGFQPRPVAARHLLSRPFLVAELAR